MSEIKLLHLSDLHLMLSAEGGSLRNAVLSEAEAQFAGLPVGQKLLVLTGDFHSFGENYAEAKKFLPRLFDAMGLEPARDVFMVPGNHDLDASSKGSFRRKSMIKSLREQPEDIASDPEAARELLSYYQDYLSLARELGVYSEEDCRSWVPISVHVRTWRDTLHLLHLNTTLIADGTDKKNQLADVLSAASDEVQAPLRDGLPCISLGHNHIYDLHESQWSESLRGVFVHGGVSAYLCGDRHRTDEEPRERLMWLGTGDDSPQIPVVCAPRGSADEGDRFSERGFILHTWEPASGEVRWSARLWTPKDPLTFRPAEEHSYSMKRAARPERPARVTDLGLGDAVKLLDAETVEAEARACGPNDVTAFYRVTDRYEVMLRALAAGKALPRDGELAELAALLERGPVLIAGNGGMGKTALMLMAAIRWARAGGVAVWLRLSELGRTLDADKARRLVQMLTRRAEAGHRLLLCLDSPGRDWDALETLRRAWLGQPLALGQTTERGGCVRLVLAERSTRLMHGRKHLDLWLDDARVAELRRADDTRPPFRLGERETVLLTEERYFRKKLLLRTADTYRRSGALSRCSPQALSTLADEALGAYNSPVVSLVELIYRALLPRLRDLTPGGGVMLDWEEWGRVLRERFALPERDDFELYGGVALFYLLGAPLPVSLFCARFGLDAERLVSLLRDWRLSRKSGAIEPVVYAESRRSRDRATLEPKHDVIAEVFFLFRRGEDEAFEVSSADRLLLGYLDCVSEPEAEYLLRSMSDRKNMRQLSQRGAVRIDYRLCMERLCDRMRSGTLNLSREGRVNLCLCLLWSNGGNRLEKWDAEVQTLLEDAAPDADGDRSVSVLHTEWAIWLAGCGRQREAEEKLRAVNRADGGALPPRTELGRLLAKRTGDAKAQQEAEKLYREAMRIDPKHIHSRTELGRLLAKRTGDAAAQQEAERLYREALRIDPKHIHSRTELGRLLVKRGGAAALAEAETVYREALRIDPRDVPSRTELGRLLVKRGGAEALAEAETVYREALRIDPRNVPIRTELGRLLVKRGGAEALAEAERLYREALRIDPRDVPSRTELGRLLVKRTGDAKAQQEAEKLYREAMRIDPNHVHSRTELGRLLERIGGERGELEKLREAKSLYREILTLDKNDDRARTGLKRLSDVQ